jgi:hypothetical protein
VYLSIFIMCADKHISDRKPIRYANVIYKTSIRRQNKQLKERKLHTPLI